MSDMNGERLYRLGRRLMALARTAMADPDDPVVSAGEAAVIDDLLDHPGSAVQEITSRTGFAQSYVSATVARLRAKGWVETAVDPTDRRRTLVRLPDLMIRATAERERRSVEDALAAALPDLGAPARDEALTLLDALAQRLLPDVPAARDPGRRPRPAHGEREAG